MNRSRSSCASTAGTDWWETPKPVRAPMATCCAGHGRNSSSISEFSRASFPPQDAQVHDRRFQTSEGLEEIVLNGSRLGESCWHRRPLHNRSAHQYASGWAVARSDELPMAWGEIKPACSIGPDAEANRQRCAALRGRGTWPDRFIRRRPFPRPRPAPQLQPSPVVTNDCVVTSVRYKR